MTSGFAGSPDPLHALIKSLNQNEKRYVKLFSTHGGKPKQYLELFDLMDAEEVYVEEEFRAKHEDKGVFRNLAANRKYLKDAILKAMRSYHDERNSQSKIYSLLQDFHFLQEKGLYKMANKRLRAAKKIATQRQMPLDQLRINELETAFEHEHTRSAQQLPAKINGLQQEQMELLKALQTSYLFTNTYQQMFIAYRKGMRKEIPDELLEKLERFQLGDFQEAPERYSFVTRLRYLQTKALIAECQGDQASFMNHSRLIVQLFEEDGRTKGEDLTDYLKVVSNYLTSCHQNDHYDEFPSLLERLKGYLASTRSQDQQTELEQAILLNESLFYMNTGQWEKAREVPPTVKVFLESCSAKVNKAREMILCYNCMMIWFFNEEWDKLKPWLNRILDELRTGFRKSAIHASLVLEVIYHFERENFELVPSLQRAARRRIEGPHYHALLQHVDRANKAAILDRKRHMERLSEYLIQQTRNPPAGAYTTGLVEMLLWARARVENISLVEAHRKYQL